MSKFITTNLFKFLSENFKSMEIDQESSDFIDDWKQIDINGITFNFLRLKSGGSSNKFIIETDNDGEVGYAYLNCYDDNFEGCYLDNIRIIPKYRRLGLARKMYQYIEELIGEKLKSSPIKQSKQIKQYWNSL